MRKILTVLAIFWLCVPLLMAQSARVLFSPAQLDNLVAPIALYPDPLLAQVLLAATFPDQIDEANRMLPDLSSASLIDSQTWDVSVKAIAHYPTILQKLDDNRDWAISLGRSFVTQPVEVMKAIQRLRALAHSSGNLFSGAQLKIVVDKGGNVQIWPSNPQLLYVPVYDPSAVFFHRATLSFDIGIPIGAWLNRDCDWEHMTVFNHGWEVRNGWVADSRPFITITSPYASSPADNVEMNREVVGWRVNGKNLDRYNSIHAAVSYDNPPIGHGTDEDSALHDFAEREQQSMGKWEHINTVAFELGSPGDFDANAARIRGKSSRETPVTSQKSSGYEERLFHTAEEAMAAVGAAAKEKNQAALAMIFGPDNLKILLTGDQEKDSAMLDQLAANFIISAKLQKVNVNTYTLVVGDHDWPFLIPIIREGGHWRFDTVSGQEELLNQRIGENELAAIMACRTYAHAQAEYFNFTGAAGAGHSVYAQRFISAPGTTDGLYWDASLNNKVSPLGIMLAQAGTDGRNTGQVQASGQAVPGEKWTSSLRSPYHGYYFKILTRAGRNGREDYVVDDRMVGGYALIAYPDHWGVSGFMTFMINSRGRVYEKNLGPLTSQIAGDLTEYYPDPGWKLVDDNKDTTMSSAPRP
jgi:hypothetical protein